MGKRLNADQIRERLNVFLDKHYQVSPTMWSARMGLSHMAMLKFLSSKTKPHRRTLGKIDSYLEKWEESEVNNTEGLI